ncbi:MAG: tRNA (N(6)-L-threonylcarbamoyladenosine(37)-C(2))-methylthiotransferase MtaB [Ruminococcaceae bacterium]|nr:tRNA (N(6)-L-threonylcarbamoyladenosine(37)-C(2))-methylthiotransferase MtaB [Oscillospiraceae bacterium]
MQKTFAIYTLGCKVNQYETEAVAELLENAGYRQIPFEYKADVYLINTCSVTGESDRKNRQVIRRAHRQNPESVIAVMGCYAQVAEEEVRAIEGVDIVVGTQGRSQLPELINQVLSGRFAENEIPQDIVKHAEYERLSVKGMTEHQRAFVKIQDGCDRFCTYCIIPYSRGHIRSRLPEDIIEEIEDLAEAGYKEVVLTGIHLASYGRDLDIDEDLISIAAKIEKIYGIERIRLGSLEPVFMTEEKIKTLSENKKLCRQFHVALQSGSDTVLKRMNRRYTSGEYMDIINMLKKYMPDSTFTTDIMVGFPGETQQEFEESKVFAEKVGFSKMHVFPYSPRKGTKAADMDCKISNEVKTFRAQEMTKTAEKCRTEYLKTIDGTIEQVLIEEKEEINGEIFYTGHGKNYIKVYISEMELMMEDEIINSIKNVRLQLQNDRLYGTI